MKDAPRVKFLHNINKEVNAFKKQLEHIDILIATPLKFIKTAKKAGEEFDRLEFLVFDEADRYFEFVRDKQDLPRTVAALLTIPSFFFSRLKNLAKQMKKILEHFEAKTSLTYLLFSATI